MFFFHQDAKSTDPVWSGNTGVRCTHSSTTYTVTYFYTPSELHYLFGLVGFADLLGQYLLSNMTLLTSVIGMSYSGGTEVWGGDEGGGRE